jgi:hypothetical protein
MVGVVGSSPIAPTKFGKKNKHLADTLGAFFVNVPCGCGKSVANRRSNCGRPTDHLRWSISQARGEKCFSRLQGPKERVQNPVSHRLRLLIRRSLVPAQVEEPFTPRLITKACYLIDSGLFVFLARNSLVTVCMRHSLLGTKASTPRRNA